MFFCFFVFSLWGGCVVCLCLANHSARLLLVAVNATLQVKHMDNGVVFAIIAVWMIIALCLVQYVLRPPRVEAEKSHRTDGS
jgi:hypothetical protein